MKKQKEEKVSEDEDEVMSEPHVSGSEVMTEPHYFFNGKIYHYTLEDYIKLNEKSNDITVDGKTKLKVSLFFVRASV
jgi:hypothetical protein